MCDKSVGVKTEAETEREYKKVFFSKSRDSVWGELIHRDYKHYFGISLGINFLMILRREWSIRQRVTSGHFFFDIEKSIRVENTIETAVSVFIWLYFTLYVRLDHYYVKRLINLNRTNQKYCWRLLITKKVIFSYISIDFHFYPNHCLFYSKKYIQFIICGVFFFLFVINYLITCFGS